MSTEMVLEEKSTYPSTSTPNYDAAWKNIIEKLFRAFVAFFAPGLYEKISFATPPEFLNKELHEIIIENRDGTNYTDQIVKVSLKDGTDKWILIHVEVQDKVTRDFPDRMFRYFYRIYDKFDHEIYAIAVITSETKSAYPDYYRYSFQKTKLTYEYDIFKFHDYTIAELEKSDNPFAAAGIAAKYANKSKKDETQSYKFKRKLMKQVLKKYSLRDPQSRIYIEALFYFIDVMLSIPQELQEKLRNEIIQHAEKEGFQMSTTDREMYSPTLDGIVEKLAKDRIEKGIEEGIEEGKQKGIEEAKITVAKNLMKENFSDEKIAKLTDLDIEKVRTIRESLD